MKYKCFLCMIVAIISGCQDSHKHKKSFTYVNGVVLYTDKYDTYIISRLVKRKLYSGSRRASNRVIGFNVYKLQNDGLVFYFGSSIKKHIMNYLPLKIKDINGQLYIRSRYDYVYAVDFKRKSIREILLEKNNKKIKDVRSWVNQINKLDKPYISPHEVKLEVCG